MAGGGGGYSGDVGNRGDPRIYAISLFGVDSRLSVPHLLSLLGTVHHDRIDFGDSIDRNAIALLQCQRMVGGLKLDPWPKAVVAKMKHPSAR